MKKLFIYFVVLLSVSYVLFPLTSAGASPTSSPSSANTPASSPGKPDPASLNCKSAVLMDASTGNVLFSKNPDEKIYPASTTKLMTALVLLEKCKPEDEVKCGAEVHQFRSSSSLAGLKQNEKVTVEQLLYASLLISGNDAAATAAVHAAGSQDAFVQLMNSKAEQLGLTGTHFENPHGLQNENHYSTARDMANLARTVMQNETIANIVKTQKYTMAATNLSGPREFINTNRLLASKTADDQKYLYQYATGMKTGSTPVAGNCLVASAEKDGAKYIVTIYDEPTQTGNDRWGIAKTLFDYAFSLQSGGVDTGTIRNGDADIYSIIANKNIKQQVKNADASDPQNGMLDLTVTLDDAQVSALSAETIAAIKANPDGIEASKNIPELTAPIAKGQELGTVTYKFNNQTLFTGTITASRDVAAAGGVTAQASQPGYVVTPPQKDGFNFLWVIIPGALLLIILLRILTRRRSLRKRRRRVSRRRTTYYNF